MSNPTIVLVPGAWHQPAHYSVLIRLLEGAGYKVVTEKLPGVDSSTPTQESTANDAAFIKKQLLDPLVDEGIDILLLMHSYGGCPGAAAAKGYSKKERTAAGKKGGIIGLVFMVAFLANEGDSLLSKLPNQEYDPWVVWNKETSQLHVSNPKNVFFNDLNEADAKVAISQLKLQAEPALSSPSGPPAWSDSVYDGKRAYIQAALDNGIPFVAQDAMVTYSGLKWDTIKLDTGHSPFLSQPQAVADFVVDRLKAYAY